MPPNRLIGLQAHGYRRLKVWTVFTLNYIYVM